MAFGRGKTGSRSEEQLKQELLCQVAEQVAEGVAVFDVEDRLVYANPAIRELYGDTGEDPIGRPLSSFWAGSDTERRLFHPTTHHMVLRSEVSVRRRDGSLVEAEVTISSLFNACGDPIGRIVCVRDLTQRKDLERRLMRAASHDVLTDLPNRRLLADRLEHALAGARRTSTAVTILFIDLDGFKTINDQFGHSAGDALLLLVVERLRQCIREGDTLARLGGDEFVLLLENVTEESQPKRTAQRISELLGSAFDLNGTKVNISASIGIASASQGDQDTLLRSADAAMYEAKSSGPGRIAHSLN
jgi:diguanylate cyclase (GGDEF)-like protein/PAS domain S-box-containing protein